MRAAQGERAVRRRPPRTMRPAVAKSRNHRRFPATGGGRGQCEHLGSGEQLGCEPSSHQTWFGAKPCSGRLRRPVSLAQRIRSSHRALRRWRSSGSELPTLRAGREAANPVPVNVGEPQLRSGVRALLAGDDPHAGRPTGEVQQAGQALTGNPTAPSG